MIELIFSIVIMGIVMLSAPMLISTAVKSTSVALQQEGINEAAARLNLVMTYEWDENALQGVCQSQPPILTTTAGDSELNVSASDPYVRAGTDPGQTSHRFDCLRNNRYYAASTALGKEGNLTNDIDDFDGNTALLDIASSGTGGKDYIERSTVQINTATQYISDTANYAGSSFSFAPSFSASPGTTNIKAITVTLTSTSGVDELEKTIVLRAFSSNAGSYHYHKDFMP